MTKAILNPSSKPTSSPRIEAKFERGPLASTKRFKSAYILYSTLKQKEIRAALAAEDIACTVRKTTGENHTS
jgi:hypothetical protein